MLLTGDPAERSDTGLHQLREAHMLGLGEENAPPRRADEEDVDTRRVP